MLSLKHAYQLKKGNVFQDREGDFVEIDDVYGHYEGVYITVGKRVLSRNPGDVMTVFGSMEECTDYLRELNTGGS